jgi:hypothetical protein
MFSKRLLASNEYRVASLIDLAKLKGSIGEVMHRKKADEEQIGLCESLSRLLCVIDTLGAWKIVYCNQDK